MQQRLKSLSSELVTLRNRLHVSQRPSDVTAIDGSPESAAGCKVAIASLITSASNRLASNGQFHAANVQLMSGTQSKSATDTNNKLNSKVCVNGWPMQKNPNLFFRCFRAEGEEIDNGNWKNIFISDFRSQAFADSLVHEMNTMPIISPRNTSIPHPLPQHVTGKTNGKI